MFTIIVYSTAASIMLLMIFPPFVLFGLPLCWKLFRMFGEDSVAHSRYFLVPGWSPARSQSEEYDEKSQTQGQKFGVKIIK